MTKKIEPSENSKYSIRTELREKIRAIQSEHRAWNKKDHQILEELNKVHAEITFEELKDNTKKHEKSLFSVCGYSYKHGYFRSKVDQYETIGEAIAKLNELKSDPTWGIPTVIVKETYLRLNCLALVDFDTKDFNLSFADVKEVVKKHKCGDQKHSWDYLLDISGDVCY